MKTKVLLFATLLLFVGKLYSQDNKALDLKLGAAVPVIKFGELYETGFSANIGFIYKFFEKTKFTLTTGYINFPFDNEKYNAKYADYDRGEYFNLKAPITVIPILIGIRYYLTDKKVQPYVMADFGFYFYSQKLSGNYTQDGLTVPAPEIKENTFSTMFDIGFGITYPLSKVVDFDLQGKFTGLLNANAVSGSGNSSAVSTASNTYFHISFLAGINYYLN